MVIFNTGCVTNQPTRNPCFGLFIWSSVTLGPLVEDQWGVLKPKVSTSCLLLLLLCVLDKVLANDFILFQVDAHWFCDVLVLLNSGM